MTLEDCEAALGRLRGALPVAAEFGLDGGVTPEDWCRVADGPMAGLDWRTNGVRGGFVVEFRKAEFEVPDLGEFRLTGEIVRLDGAYRIGPVLLRRESGDAIVVNATLVAPATGSDGLGSMVLDEAELMVVGVDGIVADVLSWAFRTDIRSARSNITEADDQRAEMRDWLEELPSGFLDTGSRGDFRTMIRSYPLAAGMAVLSVPEDRDVAVGPLIAAVLSGAPFSEGDAAALVRDAGLTFRWTPE